MVVANMAMVRESPPVALLAMQDKANTHSRCNNSSHLNLDMDYKVARAMLQIQTV